MTDDFDLFEDEAARDAEERRRSIWTMLIVLCFAVVVAGLAVVLLLNSPGEKYHERQLAGPSVTASYSAPTGPTIRVIPTFTETISKPRIIKSINPSVFVSTTASSSPGSTPTATSSLIRTTGAAGSTPPPPPPSTPHNTFPCPTYSPCIIGGDGNAIDEVHKLRGDSVPGFITGAAQAKALNLAQGGSCGAGCAFEYAYSQDGRQVVDEIFAGQSTWLSGKHLQQFQVGWAYNPVNSLYYCALLQN